MHTGGCTQAGGRRGGSVIIRWAGTRPFAGAALTSASTASRYCATRSGCCGSQKCSWWSKQPAPVAAQTWLMARQWLVGSGKQQVVGWGSL